MSYILGVTYNAIHKYFSVHFLRKKADLLRKLNLLIHI